VSMPVYIKQSRNKPLHELIKNRYLYIMAVPIIAYFIVFYYLPMYGVVISFLDYSPFKGIYGSSWVGLKHFNDFFSSYYFWRLIRNTFLINLYDLVFNFPSPIILALSLNEVRNTTFKRTVQTITYMPYFISLVVVVGLLRDMTSSDGIILDFLSLFGFERVNLMGYPQYFRGLFVGSNIWQGIGFNSILYLSAISSIDPTLYEAATVDGAGRWRRVIHITIPGISGTIITLFILRMGSMMSVGYEKIILMYNPVTLETADVISSFVYRKGLIDSNYASATAIGLFNSLLNCAFLLMGNRLSKSITKRSLW
jgi:putative aldouronate transport system permease protein